MKAQASAKYPMIPLERRQISKMSPAIMVRPQYDIYREEMDVCGTMDSGVVYKIQLDKRAEFVNETRPLLEVVSWASVPISLWVGSVALLGGYAW